MRVAVVCASLVVCVSGVVSAQPASTPVADAARAEAARTAPSGTTPSVTASNAQAEQPTRTRLQLGVSLKGTLTPGVDTANELGPTFEWRWRGKGSRHDDRWALAYRLSSFGSQVWSQLGATELPVGDVKVRPLMVGVDYNMPRGKWQWAAGMSGGWAINAINTPAEYAERATNVAGASDLWVDVHNSFVWGPHLKGWYDHDRRLSYTVEAAYLVTRPELDVRANGFTATRPMKADALILKAGIVYGIF
jgi:hypothetical protein